MVLNKLAQQLAANSRMYRTECFSRKAKHLFGCSSDAVSHPPIFSLVTLDRQHAF